MIMPDANDKRNQSGGMFGRVTDEFAVRSATSGVGWDVEDVQPFFPCYIGVDDALFISAASSSGPTLNINVRVLGLDGLIHPLTFQFAPSVGNRQFTNARFQLMEGWLLSLVVIQVAGMAQGNWCYATVGLQRAPFGPTQQYQTLVAGYTDINIGMSYPESVTQRASDGAGVPIVSLQSNPGAGADFSVSVPLGARWRVIAWRGTLTTAVAVANRDVSITYNNGATVMAESPSGLVLAASSANTYCYFDGATLNATAFNGRTVAPLPGNCFLQRGFSIQTATTGIQAADQWSGITMIVQEWSDSE